MKKFFAAFKAFISQGNIIDMAVGVVIGTAFKAIVSSLVADIINPLIALITGDVDLKGLKYVLVESVKELDATTGELVETQAEVAITYGMFIQAIIDFLKSIGSFLVNVIGNAVILVVVFVAITICAFVYNRIR